MYDSENNDDDVDEAKSLEFFLVTIGDSWIPDIENADL